MPASTARAGSTRWASTASTCRTASRSRQLAAAGLVPPSSPFFVVCSFPYFGPGCFSPLRRCGRHLAVVSSFVWNPFALFPLSTCTLGLSFLFSPSFAFCFCALFVSVRILLHFLLGWVYVLILVSMFCLLPSYHRLSPPIISLLSIYPSIACKFLAFLFSFSLRFSFMILYFHFHLHLAYISASLHFCKRSNSSKAVSHTFTIYYKLHYLRVQSARSSESCHNIRREAEELK